MLSNAAWFYEASDQRQAVDLLRRALALLPADRQIADQLGYEYAEILAGVKQMSIFPNRTGKGHPDRPDADSHPRRWEMYRRPI